MPGIPLSFQKPSGYNVNNSLFPPQVLTWWPSGIAWIVKTKYWPIEGRNFVGSVLNKCVRCFWIKPKIFQHIMGSLPADRVRSSSSFHTTGIDFCGPIFFTKLRLETSNRTNAIFRFTSASQLRPLIWKLFITYQPKNELAELKELFKSEPSMSNITATCLSEGIDSKFIPPRSPHFGGLWEAAVNAAKFNFYRVVGPTILTFDELRTLVYEISAILNSRPLCPISEDPNNLEVLTPAHFLKGSSFNSFPERLSLMVHAQPHLLFSKNLFSDL